MEPVNADDPTIGKLVADASRDVSTLISKEIQLAKSELKVSVRTGGIGAGLLAGAAFIGLIVIILLSITIAEFITWDGDGEGGLPRMWSYLIVTAFYILIAVILVLVGVKKLKSVGPPERAIAQAQGVKGALSKGSESTKTNLDKR